MHVDPSESLYPAQRTDAHFTLTQRHCKLGLQKHVRLSGRYTVRCNLADIVIRVSSRTMISSREPCTCRHTLSVTRTGGNAYALIRCIRSYSDKSRNNFVHAQTMASAILFESRTTILATVQHNWQCIPWLYIDSTKEFHVRRYEHISKQDRCILRALPTC